MTVTVIVFFHVVIIVENESVFPKAEKYSPTLFQNTNILQLTSRKILKQHRNATAITHHTTLPPINEQRKRIYVSYQSINIYTSNFRCTTGRAKTMNKE